MKIDCTMLTTDGKDVGLFEIYVQAPNQMPPPSARQTLKRRKQSFKISNTMENGTMVIFNLLGTFSKSDLAKSSAFVYQASLSTSPSIVAHVKESVLF